MGSAAKTRDLQLIAFSRVPLIHPGTDLLRLICDIARKHGPALLDDDVVVIAQKIVSKAEGRYVDLAAIKPGEQALALSTQVQKDAQLVEVILERVPQGASVQTRRPYR